MNNSLDLIFRMRADNQASQAFNNLQKDIEKTEKEIEDLQKIASGLVIHPTISAADATNQIQNLKQSVDDMKKSMAAIASSQQFKLMLDGITLAAKGTSDALVGVGSNLISAAANAETLEIAMKTAFQGAEEEAQAMLGWAKQFANVTPFETNEVIEATIKLKAYGVEAEKIPKVLTNIGDMASGMGKSLNQAVEAYADASTGELERLKEFGITKKMIDDQLNGTLLNAKGQITDLNLLLEGLVQIMEERFAGGMKEQSKTYSGAVSNLEGSITNLKESFGKELLPVMKQVVLEITNIVEELSKIDPELRKTIIAFGGMATGIAFTTATVAGAVNALAPLGTVITALGLKIATSSNILTLSAIPSITAMRTAVLGYITTMRTAATATNIWAAANATLGASWVAALPIVAVGAMIVALGGLLYATQEYQMATAELQRTDMESGTNKLGESIKKLKEYFPEATTGTLAFNDAMKQGLPALLATAEGAEKITALLKTLANEQLAHTRRLEEARKERDRLQAEQDKLKPTDKKYFSLQEQIDDQQKIIDQEEKYIKTKREQRAVIYDAQKAHKAETSAIAVKESLKDADFKKMLSNLETEWKANRYTSEQKIQALKEFQSEYELTTEQNNKIRAKIVDEEDRIAKEQDKINKERLKNEQKHLKEQDKLTKKALKEKEKANKETIDYILEEEKKSDEEKRKLAEEEKKKEEERLRINEEIQNKIQQLNTQGYQNELFNIRKQVEEWQKAGADEVAIEEWKHKSIQKLQTDTLEDFKRKEEEKLNAIKESQKQIEAIELQIEEKRKQQRELESGGFGEGLPMMEGFSPLGQYAEGGETPHVTEYGKRLEESKKIEEDINALDREANKLKAEANKLEADLIKIKNDEITATNELISALGNASTALNNLGSGGGAGGGIGQSSAVGIGGGAGAGISGGTGIAGGGNPTSQAQLLNQSYAEAMNKASTPEQKDKIQSQYMNYASQIGLSPEDAFAIGTGQSQKYGFDNPINDMLAGTVGKNIADMLGYSLKGLSAGLRQYNSNISNINNQSSSFRYTTNNNNYFGGFNLNKAPQQVQKSADNMASWAMYAKIVR